MRPNHKQDKVCFCDLDWPAASEVAHNCYECGTPTKNVSVACCDCYAQVVSARASYKNGTRETYEEALIWVKAQEIFYRLYREAARLWQADHPPIPGGRYEIDLEEATDRSEYAPRRFQVVSGPYAGTVFAAEKRQAGAAEYHFTRRTIQGWMNERGLQTTEQLDEALTAKMEKNETRGGAR